jgi:hypothetical protein
LYKLALNEIGDIYVGIDSSKALPKALETFENTQSYIQSTQKVYRVFKKRVQAKTEVELNFNTIDAEALVFALPASSLQPPFDLKTTTTYKAVEAKGIGEGIKKWLFRQRTHEYCQKRSKCDSMDYFYRSCRYLFINHQIS